MSISHFHDKINEFLHLSSYKKVVLRDPWNFAIEKNRYLLYK